MSSKTKPTATKETGKPALVPQLRFPEFRDAAVWKEKMLGNEGELFSSLTGKAGADFDAGKARFVTYMNVFSNTFTDPKALRFVDVKEGENQNAVLSGDVFFTISSETPDEVGMSSVLLEDLENCYLNSFCALFRFSESKRPNPVFVGYLLRQPLVRAYFTKKAQGSTRFNLSKDAFRSLPLCLPTSPEQQKIAECLSSVDELIAAQARKLDALKTHKKGLMQQLFPRESETQPRLRFPEFQNAGDWLEKKLGNVCEIQRGKFSHRPRNDPRFFGGQYPFIQTGDVVKSGGGAVIASQSLNEEGLAVSKLFKPTIVLITIAANIGDTGLLQTEGCLTDSVVGLIPKKDVIPVFLELIMRGQKENLNKVATTGAQKNINNEILREVSVLLPSVPEQQRIADCLSSLDDLIAAQTQTLEALETHKQGLMQQLFPSLELVEA